MTVIFVWLGSPAEWIGGRLAISRSRVRIPADVLPSADLGKLFAHMCLSPVMLGGWGGNRGPGGK